MYSLNKISVWLFLRDAKGTDFVEWPLYVLKGGWHLTSFSKTALSITLSLTHSLSHSLTHSLIPPRALFPCFSPPPVWVKCWNTWALHTVFSHTFVLGSTQSTQRMSVCSNTNCIRWKPAYYKSCRSGVIQHIRLFHLLRELAYNCNHLVNMDNTSSQSQREKLGEQE